MAKKAIKAKKKSGRTNATPFILEQKEKIFELARAGLLSKEISEYIGVSLSMGLNLFLFIAVFLSSLFFRSDIKFNISLTGMSLFFKSIFTGNLIHYLV